MKKLSILLICLSVIYSCGSDSEPDIMIIDPDVITNGSVVGNSGGVTFTGSIESNGNTLTTFGFEYSLNEAMNSNVETVVASGNASQFSYTVSSNLQSNEQYFFRAFARTDNNATFYGDVKSFVSNGSAPPEITALSSEVGYMGDEIEITGINFENDQGVFVDFSGEIASVLSFTNTSIRCIVPQTLTQAENIVRVTVDGKEDTYSFFKLHTPIITSVTPIQAFFGDEIVITGEHFGLGIDDNSVLFDLHVGDIVSANRNEIRVTVPIEIDRQSVPLLLTAQFQQVFYQEDFMLHPPEITGAPTNAETNDIIEITGQYFHPTLSLNKVFIEDQEAEVQSGDTNSLFVKVPLGPYPNRTGTIRVEVLDMQDEYETPIEIDDEWVMISNSLPFRFNRSVRNPVVINNVAYLLSFSDNVSDENIYLYKFNENDFSWERENIPFEMDSFGVSAASGDKIYVYTAEADNAFWEYDTNSGVWTRKADYIGNRRDGATVFTIGDEIYIGIGVDFDPSSAVPYTDVFKYSPSTDSWSAVADYAGSSFFVRLEPSTFVINNVAYVGNGATNTGMIDFWSYNPSSNQWTQVADFPDARLYTAAFMLNGKGYVTGGTRVGGSERRDCWEYDPALNTWVQVGDVGRINRDGHFAFVLNGKVYLGGGGEYDFYQYIP